MKKQNPKLIPHVACPSCGEISRIDHTEQGQEYIWWCDNEDCGKQYQWVQNKDGSIDAGPTGVIVEKVSILLKLEPQNKPLFLLVNGIKKDNIESYKYFYEQHTCPVNYFKDAEELYFGGDDDPHGIFEFVGEMKNKDEISFYTSSYGVKE